MNIDLMRNAVIQGQIATVTAQIATWEIYSDRTGEDVTNIVSELQEHITRLSAMIKIVV